MSEMPELLYIMGTARSGSTILEILLAGGRDVFGAGELTSLVEDGFFGNKACSCGKVCHQCEIWGQVLSQLGSDEAGLRLWADIQKKLDWHDGFLRQVFGRTSRTDQEQYRVLNGRLLDAIRRRTGCKTILDSSKYAGRAVALARIVGADMKVICLTRSPAGLISAFRKPNLEEQLPKRLMSAAIYYVIALASLRVAISLLGRRRVYMLRYESLVADPQGVLQDIARWSSLDLSVPNQKLNEDGVFAVGHLVTGNRLRKSGNVRFQPSMGDSAGLGFGAGLAALLMNGWRWLLRF